MKNNDFSYVSVIIPTYNRPHLVGNAIKSVLNQTYPNFEILVVDDSDNDETERMVKKLENPKIKYVKITEINTSFPPARKKNFGVKNSNPNSKYVAFLDDDDEWLPRYLEATIKELDSHPDLSGVIPQGLSKLRDGTILKKRTLRPSDFRFWKHGIGNCWTLRKSIFSEENIWYDENCVFEDLDFSLRLRDHKFKIIPEILWISYPLPEAKGVSSTTKFERQANNVEYFFKKHYSTYKEAGKEALGFLYYFTGKIYCQAGRIKEGRNHFKKALTISPNFEYFIYYLISLLFPKIFQNYQIQLLKHKLFQK